jgi:hypothetical protein
MELCLCDWGKRKSRQNSVSDGAAFDPATAQARRRSMPRPRQANDLFRFESKLLSVSCEPSRMQARKIYTRSTEPPHHGLRFISRETKVLECDSAGSSRNWCLRVEQNLPGINIVTDIPTIPAFRIFVEGKRYDFDAVRKLASRIRACTPPLRTGTARFGNGRSAPL